MTPMTPIRAFSITFHMKESLIEKFRKIDDLSSLASLESLG